MMDTEVVAIAIGLVVSLVFTELFQVSSGGMIVPGYLALYITRPMNIVMTLIAAFATYWIVRSIGKVAIVYGRRRIVLMVLCGFLIGSMIRAVGQLAAGHEALLGMGPSANHCFSVVGFIIPGLIALWMDRQGTIQTLGSLMTSSVMVRLVLILVGLEIAV